MASSVAAVLGPALAIVFLAVAFFAVVGATSFIIRNDCDYTVWPAISSGAGLPAATNTTGFELPPGESRVVPMPSEWWGRVWARTLCNSTDSRSGRFTCATGDCGTGNQECVGGNAAPPVTLVQIVLNGTGCMDFYSVSLVDGFNVVVRVEPKGTSAGGNCVPTGCEADLNSKCPTELRVMSAADGAGVVACKSACQAFGSPMYCCTGDYGNPDMCKPTPYSQFFKKACPRAYSYPYDGASSSFTCAGGSDIIYAISFCGPIMISVKSPSSRSPGATKSSSLIALVGSSLGLLTTVLGIILQLRSWWRGRQGIQR